MSFEIGLLLQKTLPPSSKLTWNIFPPPRPLPPCSCNVEVPDVGDPIILQNRGLKPGSNIASLGEGGTFHVIIAEPWGF